MIVTPDKIKEGEKGIIKHWVNQPQYVGDVIRRENGKLIRTTQTNKIDTESVDMRYPWWCKVQLI